MSNSEAFAVAQQRYAGKVVVIVGAASGYGRATALRMALEGAHVVAIDPDANGLRRLDDEISDRSARCTQISTNIADYGQLLEAAAQVGAAHKAVDALVNYHVDLAWGSVEECDVGSYERVVRHNMIGPLAATKAFLGLLKAARGAAVVHLGSVDGIYGNPRVVSYSTSKAGLIPLTHIMAREFAPYEIRVNAVASAQTNQVPDDVSRRQLSATLAKTASGDPAASGYPGNWYLKQLSDATPLKRSGPPEEWAGTVAFLASSDASYVTGSVVVVDCGRTGLTPGSFPWQSASTV